MRRPKRLIILSMMIGNRWSGRKPKPQNPHSVRSAIPVAFQHLRSQGEGDIFPLGRGLYGLSESSLEIAKLLDSDIRAHKWETPSEFLISRYPMKLRRVTRFSGIDMVFAEALIFACGSKIEQGRRPAEEKRIFSHRFAGLESGELYQKGGWNAFAQKGMEHACDSKYVLKMDIKDCYASLRHSVLRRVLLDLGIAEGYVDCIMNCVAAASAGNDRGVPIGPHFAHLLAEAMLTEIDNHLVARSARFCRYIDDFHVFFEDKTELYAFERDLTDQLSALGLRPNHEKTVLCDSEEYLRSIQNGKLEASSPEEIKLLALRGELCGEYPVRPGTAALTRMIFKKREADSLIASTFDRDDVDFMRAARILRTLRSCGIRDCAGPVTQRLHRALPLTTESIEFISTVVGGPEDLNKTERKALLDFYDHAYVRNSEYLQIMMLHAFRAMSKGEAFESLLTELPYITDAGSDELRRL